MTEQAKEQKEFIKKLGDFYIGCECGIRFNINTCSDCPHYSDDNNGTIQCLKANEFIREFLNFQTETLRIAIVYKPKKEKWPENPYVIHANNDPCTWERIQYETYKSAQQDMISAGAVQKVKQ